MKTDSLGHREWLLALSTGVNYSNHITRGVKREYRSRMDSSWVLGLIKRIFLRKNSGIGYYHPKFFGRRNFRLNTMISPYSFRLHWDDIYTCLFVVFFLGSKLDMLSEFTMCVLLSMDWVFVLCCLSSFCNRFDFFFQKSEYQKITLSCLGTLDVVDWYLLLTS